MRKVVLVHLVSMVALVGCLVSWQVALPEQARAEAIDVDSLPQGQKAYRASVKKFLTKVDNMVSELKSKSDSLDLPEGKRPERVILELISLRDITERELEKFDFTEHGAFTEDEIRNSVNNALRILGERYERASEYIG